MAAAVAAAVVMVVMCGGAAGRTFADVWLDIEVAVAQTLLVRARVRRCGCFDVHER